MMRETLRCEKQCVRIFIGYAVATNMTNAFIMKSYLSACERRSIFVVHGRTALSLRMRISWAYSMWDSVSVECNAGAVLYLLAGAGSLFYVHSFTFTFSSPVLRTDAMLNTRRICVRAFMRAGPSRVYAPCWRRMLCGRAIVRSQ